MSNNKEAVFAYKHPGVIGKLQKELNLSEGEAQSLFQDTLGFLWLCANEPGKFCPSKKIDEAWHRFILFTRDYHSFCDTYFGRYIHHGPLVAGRTLAGLTRGTDLFAIAGESFPDSLNIENWLSPDATSTSCCSGCEEDHGPNCQCSSCQYDRYLQTPEGRAEQIKKEAEKKRDEKARAPVIKARRELDDSKYFLDKNRRKLKTGNKDIRKLEDTVSAVMARVGELKNTLDAITKNLPELEKTVARKTRVMQIEEEKYKKKNT